jgi:hypothetical protein
VWHSALPDDRPSPRGEQTRGVLPSDTEGSHHVPREPKEVLPLVILGIRTAFKEDLQASVAELVYGVPRRIPGELQTSTADPVDPLHLITDLFQHMARLRPVPFSTPRLPGHIHAQRS